MIRFSSFAVIALMLSGCIAGAADPVDEESTETDELESALSAGVNGGACALSPYNCKLRVEGGKISGGPDLAPERQG